MIKIADYTHKPGHRIRLKGFDPDDRGGFKDKDEAKDQTEANLDRLNALQEMLYAQGDKALLIVLQAMDAGGKDGTIKHVMGAFNPQGVQVASFKAPTELELAHDFLWRVHQRAPGKGMVGIFNRSHYEDVLIVRVLGLAPEEVWRARYEHINAFERLLAESSVTVVKFFLYISKEEQAERFRERQTTPDKQWKFSPVDIEQRQHWDAYMEAFEDALTACNTDHAPWYVIPANRKWFRNLLVSQILVETMEGMGLAYPPPVENIASYEIPE